MGTDGTRVTAQFIEHGEGRLFVLLRRPAGVARGCVLVAPAFAEEMNKCRRMLTLLGDALIARDVALVLVDLFGTGDSEGDFADADWQRWVRDLERAAAWSAEQGCAVSGLLGIRLGCALAAERVLPRVAATVFWQPVLDGGRAADQFLRLRVVGAMGEPDRKETTAALRARLRSGENIEVAGYELSARLVAQLDGVKLGDRLGPHLGDVAWFEVVRTEGAAAPSPVTREIDRARSAGLSVDFEAVPGEPFWSSVEILTNDRLVERTAQFLSAKLGQAAPPRALQ